MMFYERLQQIMADRNITQAQLARKMNVSRGCIHYWYWGVNEPKIEMLVRLRHILGCEWDELLGR